MWFFKKKRKKFGEILVEKGLASKGDVESALKEQKDLWESRRIQKAIGAILCERGIIDMTEVEEVLREQKRVDDVILKSLVYWLFHSK